MHDPELILMTIFDINILCDIYIKDQNWKNTNGVQKPSQKRGETEKPY
jgi:hypothetical protein